MIALRTDFTTLPENVLLTALYVAADADPRPPNVAGDDEAARKVYVFLEETPRVSLVVELNRALNKLGYTITKK